MQSQRWHFQFLAHHHSDNFSKCFRGKPNWRFNTGKTCGLSSGKALRFKSLFRD